MKTLDPKKIEHGGIRQSYDPRYKWAPGSAGARYVWFRDQLVTEIWSWKDSDKLCKIRRERR